MNEITISFTRIITKGLGNQFPKEKVKQVLVNLYTDPNLNYKGYYVNCVLTSKFELRDMTLGHILVYSPFSWVKKTVKPMH